MTFNRSHIIPVREYCSEQLVRFGIARVISNHDPFLEGMRSRLFLRLSLIRRRRDMRMVKKARNVSGTLKEVAMDAAHGVFFEPLRTETRHHTRARHVYTATAASQGLDRGLEFRLEEGVVLQAGHYGVLVAVAFVDRDGLQLLVDVGVGVGVDGLLLVFLRRQSLQHELPQLADDGLLRLLLGR